MLGSAVRPFQTQGVTVISSGVEKPAFAFHPYSVTTAFTRFRGWSTSYPFCTAT
jgi:hypothetical protein